MSLEFLVIGAQKAGTTTLWNLLRDHPELWLPDAKEAPFFSHTEVYERGLGATIWSVWGCPDGEGVLRGTVTPHYMHGWHDASTRTVAERIARQLPEVRLVVLLRDPVARARSQHAMAVARGRERRDVETALSESLRSEALREGRLAPNDTNSYVAQGEYGRILGEYLSLLSARGALHVELSDILSRDPRGVVRRVLRFLGYIRGSTSPLARFGARSSAAESRAYATEELVLLLRAIDAARRAGGRSPRPFARLAGRARSRCPRACEEFERIVHRYLAAPSARWYRERVGLEFTLRKIWNVVPSPPEPISDELRAALYAHFAEDAPRWLQLRG